MKALVILSGILFTAPLLAEDLMPIKAYLQTVKAAGKSPDTGNIQDTDPLLSELQLRATLKDDQLDEVKFHITPFGWGEREKLRSLSQLERGLLEADLQAKANANYYAIWRSILDLKKARTLKFALEELMETSEKLLKVMGANSEELSTHPDNYITALSEHQELDHKLREARAESESYEAALGAMIGQSRVSLDYNALISTEAMRDDVASTFLTVGQTDDQVKSMLADRAAAEVELETIKEHKVLDFFSVGTSFKPDGSRRAVEVGLGIDLPVGTFPVKMLELQRKKVLLSHEAESSRAERQREMKRLSSKILDRLASLKSDEAQAGEIKMENIRQAIFKTYGKRSLVALKSEFAIKKYRLEKLESVASLYADFLSLSYLKGRLDESGYPLLIK